MGLLQSRGARGHGCHRGQGITSLKCTMLSMCTLNLMLQLSCDTSTWCKERGLGSSHNWVLIHAAPSCAQLICAAAMDAWRCTEGYLLRVCMVLVASPTHASVHLAPDPHDPSGDAAYSRSSTTRRALPLLLLCFNAYTSTGSITDTIRGTVRHPQLSL